MGKVHDVISEGCLVFHDSKCTGIGNRDGNGVML